MLVEEDRRPAGPRGAGSKAAIDVEIEQHLADRVTDLLPARFVGEETPTRPGDGSPYCWLVDPHDGTWTYLRGYRGSAVSVALLRGGVPVLGVVCAPMSPDRGRDLIAWAEGLLHILRNGAEVKGDLSRATLDGTAIVFLDHGTAKRPVASGTAVAPARFISLPSIAYRLARVAAGDGVAAVSLGAPGGIDYAAGHALLRGAGGVLLDEAGREVTYSPDGMSHVRRCFGGAPEAARELAARAWSRSSRGKSCRVRRLRCHGRGLSKTTCWTAPRAASSARSSATTWARRSSFEDGGGNCTPLSQDGVRDLQDGGTWEHSGGPGDGR